LNLEDKPNRAAKVQATDVHLSHIFFETTEVEDPEAPEGKVDCVVRPELMEAVLEGPLVIVPV